MTREERKLQKHFQQHAKDQLRKLAQKQKKQRRADVGRVSDLPSGWDDEPEVVRLPKRKPVPAGDASASGMIVETHAGGCVVLTAEEQVRCRCDFSIAAGDRVLFSAERRRIVEVLPRSSALSRPDPHNPRIERMVAANIDVVVNVVSVKAPPLRPGLIDRYLIAIENSGAEPLICVNKADLIEDNGADVTALLQPYRWLGVTIVQCSAATGDGISELANLLAGRVSVFAGHSGVGKSSLLNALAPGLDITTGAVSEVHETGRHTTTASKLYRLPGGGVIIDTPGIREFGLWQVTADQVRRYFHEFDALSRSCAFSNCSHTHEPNCAVLPAIAAGVVSAARYDSYRRIKESVC
ncbi:MAG: ribosome small subunit-dependent GTPase A [Bryobacteraceae bacterium]